MKFTPGLGLIIISLFILTACTTSPGAPSTHQLVDEARQTVQNLKARKDLQEFAPMLKSAAGVAVFPAVYKAGFVVGAEVGNGVVLGARHPWELGISGILYAGCRQYWIPGRRATG